MAEIYPFRALHYNQKKIGDLSTVVTQPYDKITPEMQARYYGLSPYNLVRIIRGVQHPGDNAQENVYTRAASSLRQWIAEDVLSVEREPAIYAYDQEYSVPGQPSTRKLRRGFIALCRLEDYAAGTVHRHEATLAGPKADRLELLKTSRAHFGQIFMLYSDPDAGVERLLEPSRKRKPWESVADEYGAQHTVWRLTDPMTIENVVASMRAKKLVIADGHHRYETALAYRDYCHAQSLPDDRPEYLMATLIPIESAGLTILPTHRVVYGLPHFDWSEFRSAVRQFFDDQPFEVEGEVQNWGERFVGALAAAGRQQPTLGAYAGPARLALLRLRKDLDLSRVLGDFPLSLRSLDVILLHRLVLEAVLGIDREAVRNEKNLRYVREFDLAARQAETGQAQVAFALNPTPIEAVWRNALAGDVLPQKSTDFYPKLLSGLAMYWLDNPAGM